MAYSPYLTFGKQGRYIGVKMNAKNTRELKKRERKKEESDKEKLRKKRKQYLRKVKDEREEYKKAFPIEERIEHQEKHFASRLRKRLNLTETFNNPEIFKHVLDVLVKSGDAILIGESHGNFVYRVPLGSKTYQTIFDPETQIYKTIWEIE